ncbi:GDP-mannose 4,6-dehydratase [Fluviispira vulneris]|uniref:GDP-mannose 4,6-dehydratase n=1 Tax=Fluviispira vulneris TaxID=2763012 RepID=UPI0016476CCF|nr:GDP-mannose 4,6-dehydratase [Fluviispira vulneris]
MSNRELGRVFVTGADGFIGSHLVEELVERNFEVTALCYYNSFGNYGWLSDLIHKKKPRNLKAILGDIRDPFFMKKVLRDQNTVFHLAALIAIPYSYVAPYSYFETNLTGTLNILEACLDSPAVSRLIHTSTSEVYGTAKFIPINENHPLQGQSPYSASKIAADMAVESYFRSMSLPAVILRPFNTYGPRQSMRAIIPTIISQVLSGSTDIKLGSLKPTRDFNYVKDTVNAFLEIALANDDVLGKIFNTGTSTEISIGELVSKIEKIFEIKLNVVVENERFRPQMSEVERLISDPSKLKLATNWKPKFQLEEGLTKVIEWMKNQNYYLSSSNVYHV